MISQHCRSCPEIDACPRYNWMEWPAPTEHTLLIDHDRRLVVLSVHEGVTLACSVAMIREIIDRGVWTYTCIADLSAMESTSMTLAAVDDLVRFVQTHTAALPVQGPLIIVAPTPRARDLALAYHITALGVLPGTRTVVGSLAEAETLISS